MPALVRLDLAPDEGARAKLRAAIQRFPGNGRIPQRFQEKVANWIAYDVRPYPSGSTCTGDSNDRLDSDAHAQAVIRCVESRCEVIGVGPCLFPAAALQMAGIAADWGAVQRKADRLDDARRTAAWLSAFARTLARRDPNEAAFHLIL